MVDEDLAADSADPLGKVYFNAPGTASVRWDRGLGAVVEVWEGWANASEFKAMLDAGIEALRDNHGSRWFADCRLQRVLRKEDQKMALEWLPRALAAGMKRFAVVLPKSGLARANMKDHLSDASGVSLEMEYFETPDEAKRWLVRGDALTERAFG